MILTPQAENAATLNAEFGAAFRSAITSLPASDTTLGHAGPANVSRKQQRPTPSLLTQPLRGIPIFLGRSPMKFSDQQAPLVFGPAKSHLRT
jgi:hypothetical protein